MTKICPKCGEKMEFIYFYEPGKYASARYFCQKCSDRNRFARRLNEEGYSGEGYRKKNPV